MSGPESVAILRRLVDEGRARAADLGWGAPATAPDYARSYRAWDADLLAGGLLVPACVYLMVAPASYTREDIVEAHVPGARPVVQAVFEAMVALGARPAEPGEFTRRAFLNGRIDLAQAEAVQRVIHAQSEGELRAGMFALQGAVSMIAQDLADGVSALCAEVEADLDFSDQDIEIIPPHEAARRARELAESAGRAAASQGGTVATSAPRVAIRGPVNAGKSSLFNALLADRRAIVSPHPGATRDTVEAEELWDGLPVWIVDTAGVRPPADEVEAEAISRAARAGAGADLVVFVLDSAEPPGADALAALAEVPPERLVLALNKADLAPCAAPPENLDASVPVLRVSAEEDMGSVARLREAILEKLQEGADRSETAIPLNARHAAAMRRAQASLLRAAEAAEGGTADLAAADLREALDAIGEITGRIAPDDILDRIFSGFCIGK